MKRVLFVILLFILISFAALKGTMLQVNNTLTLANIEAQAFGEGGGEAGGDENCRTSVSYSEMTQKCDRREQTIRITMTYSCEGSGSGICNSGSVHYYYDCNGVEIGKTDNVGVKSCK